MSDLVTKVLTHFESLKAERDPWANEVEEVLKYIIPSRANMSVTTETRQYTVDRDSRDGTARASAYLMANGLLGNVCSQRSAWFKLKPELPQHLKIPGLGEWLESVEQVFYHFFNNSSFYASAWQVFLDAATSGLGSMMVSENKADKSIEFTTYAPKGAYIATDAKNHVDTYFHHFTLTARDILAEYDNENLTEAFMNQAEKKPFQRHEIIQAIFPRKDRDIYKIDAINKPFASIHVLKGQKILLRESGYDSFPMAVFRYAYDSEEVYPHSPSIDGYADIQRLNRISKATTDLAQLIAKPPTVVPAEMYNEYKMVPDFKIKGYDMNRIPQPLNTGQGYPIGRDREEYYREIVKDHYFTNHFMMLAASEGQQMTATEVMERQGEKATVIGGMVSRLTRGFLDPTFERMFIIAAQNKWIPYPPEEVLASGIALSMDYLGPLAQAQQRFLRLQGPMSSLQNFLPLLEAYPEMRDILKPFDLGSHILTEGGMPQSILRDDRAFGELQQQKQRQAQEAQAAEIMEKEASAMNKGAKAPEEGSPTDLMLQGLASGQ